MVEIRNPCPAQIYIYNCKRGSSNGGTQTDDLSYWVISQGWLSYGLGGYKNLFFFSSLFCYNVSKTQGMLGLHDLRAGLSLASNFWPDLGSSRGQASNLEVGQGLEIPRPGPSRRM